VKRILLTGMSGTGKSTLISALRARGYKAVDADDPGWSEYRSFPGRTGEPQEPEWVWREDRIQELLSTDDAEVLFLSGCASNQGQFYPQFDHIVLLSAPPSVMVERLATRTTNTFGRRPEELAKILKDRDDIEPLLRRRATLELDTSAPLEDVLPAVLELVGPGRGRPE
jgi:dephospho-CoA kinase